MPNVRRIFRVDPKLESQGIWIEYQDGQSEKPIRYLVGAFGGNNARYLAAYEKHLGEVSQQIVDGTLTDEEDKARTLAAFVEGCVFGWENVEDADGNPLEFSPENAIAHFSDPEMIHITMDVRMQAKSTANFQKRRAERDIKNLGTSSAGS